LRYNCVPLRTRTWRQPRYSAVEPS
jgi:hypothetical protein